MRAMMIATTVSALAVFLVVVPVYRTLEERRGSQRLLAAGAKLEHSIYLQRDYEQPEVEGLPTAGSTQKKLPSWAATLAGEAARMRPDDEVLEVYTHDDAQVMALCEHGERFRRLQVIDLWNGGISMNAVTHFGASLSKFPQAVDFHFHCPIPPGLLSSLGQARSIFLWGPGQNPSPLEADRLKELAAIPHLHLLWIKRYPQKLDDAIHLAQSKSLRRLYIDGQSMSAADLEKLKAAMPECDVLDEYLLKTNQQLPHSTTSWSTFPATR
jgi:hypothetical protein